MIRATNTSRPTRASLRAGSPLSIRIHAEDKAFRVLRSWEGNMIWTGLRAKLQGGAVGLKLQSTERFFLGQKRIPVGTILTRSAKGWEMATPDVKKSGGANS